MVVFFKIHKNCHNKKNVTKILLKIWLTMSWCHGMHCNKLATIFIPFHTIFFYILLFCFRIFPAQLLFCSSIFYLPPNKNWVKLSLGTIVLNCKNHPTIIGKKINNMLSGWLDLRVWKLQSITWTNLSLNLIGSDSDSVQTKKNKPS